jgi:hypothetical protein
LPVAAGIALGMGGRLSWRNIGEGGREAGACFRLALPLSAEDATAGRAA